MNFDSRHKKIENYVIFVLNKQNLQKLIENIANVYQNWLSQKYNDPLINHILYPITYSDVHSTKINLHNIISRINNSKKVNLIIMSIQYTSDCNKFDQILSKQERNIKLVFKNTTHLWL